MNRQQLVRKLQGWDGVHVDFVIDIYEQNADSVIPNY